MTSANSFGAQSYWNRPTQGRQKQKLALKPSFKPTKASKYIQYTSLQSNIKKAKKEAKNTPPLRSPSPTASKSPSQSSEITIVSPSRSVPQMPQMSKEEENDSKDEYSIVKLMKSTLP